MGRLAQHPPSEFLGSCGDGEGTYGQFYEELDAIMSLARDLVGAQRKVFLLGAPEGALVACRWAMLKGNSGAQEGNSPVIGGLVLVSAAFWIHFTPRRLLTAIIGIPMSFVRPRMRLNSHRSVSDLLTTFSHQLPGQGHISAQARARNARNKDE